MKLAHISDLHFAKASWSPLQFFSKRWLGNFNLLFSRKGDFLPERLESLPDLFRSLGVTHVMICGDVSTTSKKEEFAKAAKFVEKLQGMEVFTIPGNHDHYTKSAWKKKVFYDYFSEFNLREHGLTAKSINDDWWVVALDTALATTWISSRGKFSKELEERLEKLLSSMPAHRKIILINHFPFFLNDSPRKALIRGKELEALLKRFPQIKFYLHGHTHRHCIADLRAKGLPIVLDSGSTPHRILGSWNLIEITPKGCTIDVFGWKERWEKNHRVQLAW